MHSVLFYRLDCLRQPVDELLRLLVESKHLAIVEQDIFLQIDQMLTLCFQLCFYCAFIILDELELLADFQKLLMLLLKVFGAFFAHKLS